MKYAILSDIHGNLEAFNAVLEDLSQMNINKMVCLGDIVGYGANPKECLALVREKFNFIVAGNHDWAVSGKKRIDGFNSYARKAIEWTVDKLNDNEKRFLAELPLKIEVEGLTFVHATPDKPYEWGYAFSKDEARWSFRSTKYNTCFIGHTHCPILYALGEKDELYSATEFREVHLIDNIRSLINVGSVGQPRDGSPFASYGIYDSKEKIFYLHRVWYDFTVTQNKIISAGLPAFLADRLSSGS